MSVIKGRQRAGRKKTPEFESYLKRMVLPSFSRAELIALVRRAKGGDQEACDLVCRSVAAYVIQLAQKKRTKRLSSDDLFGAGMRGVLQAIQGFEPQKGVTFITYAHNAIEREIYNEIVWNEYDFRIPNSTRITSKNRGKILTAPTMISLSTPLGHESEEVLESTIEAVDPFCSSGLSEKQDRIGANAHLVNDLKRIVDRLMNGSCPLLPREHKIIELRFLKEKQLSLDQVGRSLCVSRERIRQLEVRALKKLRKAMLEDPHASEYVEILRAL